MLNTWHKDCNFNCNRPALSTPKSRQTTAKSISTAINATESMIKKAKHGEDMNEKRKNAKSKADFMRLAGIGPELAGFITEFVEKPDKFISMPYEKRRAIEDQMDAILNSFGR